MAGFFVAAVFLSWFVSWKKKRKKRKKLSLIIQGRAAVRSLVVPAEVVGSQQLWCKPQWQCLGMIRWLMVHMQWQGGSTHSAKGGVRGKATIVLYQSKTM
jgi:hypothetical protein